MSQNPFSFYASNTQDLWEIFSYYLPKLFFASVAIGAAVGYLLGGMQLAVAGLSITGIPFLLASIHLVLRERRYGQISVAALSTRMASIRVYALLYAVGVCYLSVIPERGYEFFLLLAILFTIAFVSTLLDNPFKGISLAVTTLLISIYSVTLRTPLFIGGTDIPPHLTYTLYIVKTGTVIPEWVSNYANFPLYHIFGATFIQLSGWSPEPAFFIAIGAVVAITPFLIYSIAARITENRLIASQTAVVYAVLPSVVYAGQYSITRTFAFVGFLLLLWVVFSNSFGSRGAMTIILGVIVLYLLFVHQVSFIQILFLLVILWGVTRIRPSSDNNLTLVKVIAVALPFLAYWIYNAEDLTSQIIVGQILGAGSTPIRRGVDESLPLYHPFEYMNTYMLGMMLLIGIVLGLRSSNWRIRTASLFTLFCSPFIMYSPVHIINRLAVLRLDRLILLLSLFTALFVTIGMRDIISQVSRLDQKYTIGVLAIMFGVFAFTGALGGIYQDTAADSDRIEWQYPKEHLEHTERAALDHTTTIPRGSHIRSDGISYKYLTSLLSGGNIEKGHYPRHDVETIRQPDDTEGKYLVRLEERESRGELVLGDFAGDYVYNGSLQVDDHSRVYDSGDSSILYKK